MSQEYMLLNGIRRQIGYISPDSLLQTGFASATVLQKVDFSKENAYQRVNIPSLESHMGEMDLEPSGIFVYGEFGPQWGFNDPRMMGSQNAKSAKEDGSSYIWLGINHDASAAKVEVIGHKLDNPTELEMFGYMNMIFDRFIGFLENPENYLAEPDFTK